VVVVGGTVVGGSDVVVNGAVVVVVCGAGAVVVVAVGCVVVVADEAVVGVVVDVGKRMESGSVEIFGDLALAGAVGIVDV
jgi:predicted membrane-bound mannosyltransferase